jgi:hypothetical protein
MKAINNRLRRLEDRFVPRESEESIIAAQIRERRRRRFEREGRPSEDKPREGLRGLTLAQVIRNVRCRGGAVAGKTARE